MASTSGAAGLSYASANTIFMSRQVYAGLADVQNDTDFLDYMEYNGKGEKIKAPVYTSGYNAALYQLIDTTGATIVGSGSSRTLTVSVLPAGSQGVVIVGQLWQLPSGLIGRIMTVPSASSFTIMNVEAGNLTLVAGGALSIAGNAQEEGSNAPDPQRRNVSPITNQVQIFRNKAERTDILKAQETEVKIKGKNFIANMAFLDAYTRTRAEVSIAFMKGRLSDTLFSDTSPTMAGVRGYGVQTTRGANEYINLLGVGSTVGSTGAYNGTDELNYTGLLLANRAPMAYSVFGGMAPMTVAKQYYKGLGSSGIAPAFLRVDGKDIDFGLEKVTTSGGYSLTFKMLRMLSNTTIFPSTSIYYKSLYFFPEGKAPLVGGGTADYYGYNWMPVDKPGDGVPEFAEVYEGALAAVPTNGTAVESMTTETIRGFRMVAPQFAGRLQILT